uniref:Interleukin-12 subunit beta n=1 Tax=Esox lucius TaxID=8010 RepID=A0A3P8ZMN6_ESOLU
MKCTQILSILFGILILRQTKSQRPKFTQSSWTLQPNVVVVNVDGSLVQHPLSCVGPFSGEAEKWRRDDDWVWRRDGEENEEILWKMNGVPRKRGNNFLVNLEERNGGGSFTCHRLDDSLLNQTMVLVNHLDGQKRILEGSTRTGYMKCSTSKHQPRFHCSWNCTPSWVGEVMFVQVDVSCSVDATGKHWTCSSALGDSDIVCSLDSSGQSVSCEDRRYCPYAEETDRISLTVYIRSNYLLEEYSSRFYLSEIVKPDQVFIKKVNNSAIEWSHPVSWNRPSSYFPLTYQIKVITGKQRKIGCTCDPLSPRCKVYNTESSQWLVKGSAMVCIRAQDSLCDSPWGDWKEYRSVTRLSGPH